MSLTEVAKSARVTLQLAGGTPNAIFKQIDKSTTTNTLKEESSSPGCYWYFLL